MLTLFKGELSYSEFMYGMPYKRMMLLRELRVKQLMDERKQNDQMENERLAAERRNSILQK